MLIVVVFSGVYTDEINRMCRFVCLRKSDYLILAKEFCDEVRHGNNTFVFLDVGVASVKFYSCEAFIIDEK